MAANYTSCQELFKIDGGEDAVCDGTCQVVLGKAMCFNGDYALHGIMSLVCVMGAALAAGLTMGLLSLDANQLKLAMEIQARDCTSPEEEAELMKEKILATKLYPIALPLFLDEIVPTTWMAIVISVTFVLMFGEIVPSAIFTGPSQMKIAASLTPVVWCFMVAFSPIAYPVAKFLDCCLHEHSGRYQLKVPQLKSLIRAQRRPADMEGGSVNEAQKHNLVKSGFEEDEVALMLGALEIKHVTAEKVMTPLDKTFMLGLHQKLDMDTMADIISSGHSRVPIYDQSRHNVRGMLIVKRLIVVDPEMKRGIEQFGLRKPLVIGLQENLLDILNQFQKGVHLALVANNPSKVRQAWKENRPVPANIHMAGILTFEDVIERLMGEDIHDESDIGALPMLKKMAFVKARMSRLRKITAIEKAKDAAIARAQSSVSVESGNYSPPSALAEAKHELEEENDPKVPLLLR